MKARPQTESLYEECCGLMPGGVSSPVRAFTHMEMTPMIVSEGKGDTVRDVDGNAYIDFCQSWGALILGHSPEPVIARVKEQLERGTSFGIATRLEKELAEKIRRHLPSIEKLRFVSSGTEATMTTIRLARGFTGRERIVKFNGHFHGHSDSLLIQAGSGVSHLPQASSKGIPRELVKLTASLPFNDLETCRNFIRAHDDIAAVLLEPIAGNMGVVPAKKEFLEMLREETAKKGIVLIFDEVITGFRVGLNGAQGHYGIVPDLTCLGKIIGGGFSAAAFGGKREIMDQIAPLGGVYHGGTHSGSPIAMCAGIETLSIIEKPGFYAFLAQKTADFLAPIRALIAERNLPIALQSEGSMFTLFFGVEKVESKEDLAQMSEAQFKDFFQYLFERGVYFSPSAYEAHFLSAAHTDEHLDSAQKIILDYLRNQ
ncbi:MAG: glutamate-1-semialdehyde 2,1-aminomutase [Candidatus Melainabacteria bacterium]|nr:glutamate-1-semialdehyde 2,1-aminomutase [Candidatus Melainabacteria bacterium]